MPDGTLWAPCWNQYGQLGDNSSTDSDTPVQVGSDIDWMEVSAGVNHSVGLKADGSLWAWGFNGFGQFGNGGIASKLIPVQIGWKNGRPFQPALATPSA